MKVTLESTTQIATITINGQDVPARIWQGTTAAGVPLFAYITRISVRRDQDLAEFERELTEPHTAIAETGVPLRLVIK